VAGRRPEIEHGEGYDGGEPPVSVVARRKHPEDAQGEVREPDLKLEGASARPADRVRDPVGEEQVPAREDEALHPDQPEQPVFEHPALPVSVAVREELDDGRDAEADQADVLREFAQPRQQATHVCSNSGHAFTG
jgi:hypothetical protein